MKECPYIDECEDELTEEHFKSFCRVRFGLLFNYNDCSTYKKMLKQKQGKLYRQRPRDWKRETTQK